MRSDDASVSALPRGSVRAKMAYAWLFFTIGVLIALTVTAAVWGVLPGDAWARDLLLAYASPPVIRTMRWIRHAGHASVLVPGGLLLIAASPRVRRYWWLWTGLIILAGVSEWALKPVVGRLRPRGTAFGFPSGHAAAAAAFYAAVIYAAIDLPPVARRALRWLAAATIILVGLARVALGAHWPSDVLAGIASGLACATAAALISQRPRGSSFGLPPPLLPPSSFDRSRPSWRG